MAGINKVFLMGYLGHDPKLRWTNNGEPVCNFSLGTTEKWKDKNGNLQEFTEWHRVVVWGKAAENCTEYLNKGSQVYIEGKIKKAEWQESGNVKKEVREIHTRNVTFLPKGGGKLVGPVHELLDYIYSTGMVNRDRALEGHLQPLIDETQWDGGASPEHENQDAQQQQPESTNQDAGTQQEFDQTKSGKYDDVPF